MNNVRVRTVLALVGLAVAGWLAFGYFGIQAAFLDDEVNEAGPVFTSTVESPDADEDAGQDVDAASDDSPDDLTEAQGDSTAADESADETDPAGEPQVASPADADADDADVADADGASDAVEASTPGEIVTLYDATFAGESRYSVSGDALVLNNGSSQRFLRFENFESDNGPDLFVYLRADNGDFVSLGELKGNIGDQNYEIPVEVDLDQFSAVQIWCERFGVNFGSAFLAAT